MIVEDVPGNRSLKLWSATQFPPSTDSTHLAHARHDRPLALCIVSLTSEPEGLQHFHGLLTHSSHVPLEQEVYHEAFQIPSLQEGTHGYVCSTGIGLGRSSTLSLLGTLVDSIQRDAQTQQAKTLQDYLFRDSIMHHDLGHGLQGEACLGIHLRAEQVPVFRTLRSSVYHGGQAFIEEHFLIVGQILQPSTKRMFLHVRKGSLKLLRQHSQTDQAHDSEAFTPDERHVAPYHTGRDHGTRKQRFLTRKRAPRAS
eukprot:scaffold1146_cov399-Prasinococcus_capsulatus_cf.AAC.48